MDRLLIPIVVTALGAGLLLIGVWIVALSVNAARERRGKRARRRHLQHRRKIDLLRPPAD